MISKLMEYCIRNRFIVILLTAAVAVLGLCLFLGACFFRRWWSKSIALALLVTIALTIWNPPAWIHLRKPGREFMPMLDEGSILDMPVTVPRVGIAQATDDLKLRDQIIASFPEVDQVVGKVGRADTPTDPSGLDMAETIITLRPKPWWPKRKLKYDQVERESDRLAAVFAERGFLKSADQQRSDLRQVVRHARELLQTLADHPELYADAPTPLRQALSAATDALLESDSQVRKAGPIAAMPDPADHQPRGHAGDRRADDDRREGLRPAAGQRGRTGQGRKRRARDRKRRPQDDRQAQGHSDCI